MKWPNQGDLHQLQEDGVTWIELVLSFMISQRVLLPIKRKGQGGHEQLVAFSSVAELAAYEIKLSDLAQTFAILCKQMHDLMDAPFLPPWDRGLVRSLYKLGSTIFSSGFRWRAQLPAQEQVLQVLRQYLLKFRGPAYSALPDISIDVDQEAYGRIRLDVRGTWHLRSADCHKAMRRVRAWKNNPQPQLDFGRQVDG